MDIQKVIDGLDALFAERQTNKVEDYLSENLEKALKEGDTGCAITIINELIGFYRDTSQYDKAEAYCGKLLPFLERAGLKDTIHYGTSCLNIANAYRASGRLEDSLEHYKIVFDIYEKLLEPKDFRYASLYNNLSLLYQEMEQFDKACDSLLAALAIVKEYPEAKVELGVTYSNLAASYVKSGELGKAEEAVKNARSVFQDGLTEDYHYTAALSGAGDVYFALAKAADREAGETNTKEQYYAKAISCYEEAMLLLKSHVGLTHAYFRIVSNLQTAWKAIGQPGQLKGLNICKCYYYVMARHLFEALGKEIGHDRLLYEITVGKVGEGSECFGYDDLLSVDHDFGPGFCIFVTREQHENFGKKLEETYNHPRLIKTYMGFERQDRKEEPLNTKAECSGGTIEQLKSEGSGLRNGVIVIEDFMKRILNLSEQEVEFLMKHHTLPEEVFLRLSDWQLKTVTNGELFEPDANRIDPVAIMREPVRTDDMQLPVFTSIYHNLRKGYPEPVRRKKLAQLLGEMCQSGQYNYQRMMLRGDTAAAILMMHDFVRGGLRLLYLINREYAPHSKWLFAGARKLPKGREIVKKLEELSAMQVRADSYETREMLEWIGTTNKEDTVLAKINDIAGDFVGLMRSEGLTIGDAFYLEEQIPYILNS